MEIEALGWLILGLAAGGAAAFFLSRQRIRAAGERARQAAESERAALSERLRGREEQLRQAKEDLTAAHAELAALRAELTRQTERRSAAEEKNSRIPELERAAGTKDALIVKLQTENGDLRTRLSEAEVKREEERRAAEEKLLLLEDARRNLSDAFQSLSAEALRSNNQSFLALAKATLEKYQEGAQNDLTVAPAGDRRACQAAEGIAGKGRRPDPRDRAGPHDRIRDAHRTAQVAGPDAGPPGR